MTLVFFLVKKLDLLAGLPPQTSTGQPDALRPRFRVQGSGFHVNQKPETRNQKPSKESFLFQLARDALVNDIFGFELANLLVAST